MQKRKKTRSKGDLRQKRERRKGNAVKEQLLLLMQKYEVLQPQMVCSLEVVQDMRKLTNGLN